MVNFNESVDMLLVLGECQCNYRLAAEVFAERFHVQKSHMSFYRLEKRVRATGSVCTKTHCKPKTVTTDVNSTNILAAIHAGPQVSTRQLAENSGISRTSIRRILKQHKYHPYHMSLHQDLFGNDFQRRITFCTWFQGIINEDDSFLSSVLFSDEATFSNTGQVNRHNLHYWSNENPQWLRSVPFQHRWSLNVWCGIVENHVIGPYFFEQHLTSAIYCDFLTNVFPTLLETVPLDIRIKMWFQQDGAPAHFARNTCMLLNTKFRNKWIGRGGPVMWPARSPDLTPLDFFLWGYIKDKVMATAPTTKEDMKIRICNACKSITPIMLEDVRNNFRKRINVCLQVYGHHFEHLIK